mmetsp:Transcript_53442/g.64425  ORF Transcript_53442/g.64425 Transcript_53442/m.64425 type:complete len:655 (+) Transcript_53442:111-2075(+)|eukprot:CAMPEP_0172511848 /NCGR_PEP_ID=MMETSP1066-20121228/239694_1 /TAXON_ID=671091 /ORGANISM="Coscinodiscus wailesii, Strain CCMP2513" /LENGTH=654 /DNA_ID=CAMNT_0013291401 /DNA_START=96 /DNA_END=2060 /DNA_ORIENTATION=+
MNISSSVSPSFHKRRKSAENSLVLSNDNNNNNSTTGGTGGTVPTTQSADNDSDDGSYDSADDATAASSGPEDSVKSIRTDHEEGEFMNERFDLCDSLHKRRGGFKMKENKWVSRCFTLYGSVLCYYDHPQISRADPSRPRGRIDLSKEETLSMMNNSSKKGAPTEYLITLNIYGLGGKRKWEMCCSDKSQQEKWYEALKTYDGKKSLEGAVTPTPPAHKQVVAPVVKKVPPVQLVKQKRNSHRRENLQRAISVSFGEKGESLLNVFNEDVVMMFVVMNVTTYIIRVGSTGILWMTVLVLNLGLVHYLRHSNTTTGHTHQQQHSHRSVHFQSPQPVDEVDPDDDLSPPPPPPSFERVITIGSTIPRAAPRGALAELIDSDGFDTPAAVHGCAAYDAEYETLPHTYWNVRGDTFPLRVGPNYKKTKMKSPSGPPLYNLYAVDMFRATSTMKSVAAGFKIPDIEGVTDVDTGFPDVPAMLVINCNMPSEEPQMFKSPTDGPSYICVVYLVIAPETVRQLKDFNNASPAVKLFKKWCETAEHDSGFRSRMKAMCVLDDIDSLGLPSFVTGYNGKPTLISKSGTFTRHPTHCEMSINVHMFAYLARKGLYSLQQKFPEFILNVGFTIEGRDDDELPETILGGCRMIQLNLEKTKYHGDQ